MKEIAIKSRENKARRDLSKIGYSLQKHTSAVDLYHVGCYRILDSHTGNIEAGADFDLTLEDVESFIKNN